MFLTIITQYHVNRSLTGIDIEVISATQNDLTSPAFLRWMSLTREPIILGLPPVFPLPVSHNREIMNFQNW
jgi:hypothetical protein